MKLAQLGHVDAQGYLGFTHQSGLGVEVDYQESLYWYEEAAEQGDAELQYSLIDIYLEWLRSRLRRGSKVVQEGSCPRIAHKSTGIFPEKWDPIFNKCA